MTSKQRIVIIGGGFGGLNSAKALSQCGCQVTLIDRMNHHVFQPLLYQVATAALAPGNIAASLRDILRHQENVSVIMKDAVAIDKKQRLAITHDRMAYPYDYLILAPGARHAYFGHPEWEQYAPGLKTLADALLLREKILIAFEKAEVCTDPQQEAAYLRFVIIGGGPTGVEMAGAIAEISKQSLKKNFRHIKPEEAEILLIEGYSQLLPSYPESLSAKARHSLETLGVQVLTNAKVTDIKENGLFIGERFIPSATLIWAAGNEASPLLKTLDISLDPQGRAIVGPDLSIPNFPEIFVIGDAACSLGKDGKMLPGVAPVAIQQGKYVAKIIKQSKPPADRPAFIYKDKGSMATIGRGKAVAYTGKIKISGFLAWLAWGAIHIYYLIGFQNRMLVLLHWLYLYVVSARPVRLIVHYIKS